MIGLSSAIATMAPAAGVSAIRSSLQMAASSPSTATAAKTARRTSKPFAGRFPRFVPSQNDGEEATDEHRSNTDFTKYNLSPVLCAAAVYRVFIRENPCLSVAKLFWLRPEAGLG